MSQHLQQGGSEGSPDSCSNKQVAMSTHEWRGEVMRRFRLASVLIATMLGLTSAVLTAPAEASPSAMAQRATVVHRSTVVSPLYAPGGASAIRPSYDPYTGKIVYKCVFVGWYPGHTVYWTCS